LTFRCIAYNTHRMVKLIVMTMVSTEPYCLLSINMKNKSRTEMLATMLETAIGKITKKKIM
jgi:hypothetical protein